MEKDVSSRAQPAKEKGLLRAFWDFFVLFSGISTASNLSRTQGRAVKSRGLFLFRKSGDKNAGGSTDES
jgi:hypothetical protein